MSDSLDMRTISTIIMMIVSIAFVVVLVVAARPRAGERGLLKFSERSGLPIPVASADHLRARVRRGTIADAVGGLVGIGLAGVLIATPLGTSVLFPLAVVLPVVGVSVMLAGTGAAVRHSLFTPSTGAPRIARSHVTTPADYLPTIPRVLAWVVAGAGLIAGCVLVLVWARAGVPRPEFAVAAVIVAVVALGSSAAIPALDRAILSRPQPATTPLELAWDDEFRASTLSAVRQSSTTLGVVALFLIGLALSTSSDRALGWGPVFINLAMLVLSRIYPTNGVPLPRPLFPNGIRVAAGSTT
ncbi:MAG: hypothetical protein J0I43_06765 [Microbacterium sp.]|uniref:hypothetical protein n=1 Tax=Microbacterium sp. TaxID=51671 RepID=UPI001AC50D94|nr:hypothetical protein [Microbacterium sp.]MBN9177054.1 hypothetical protein [Microbacterium sp.]